MTSLFPAVTSQALSMFLVIEPGQQRRPPSTYLTAFKPRSLLASALHRQHLNNVLRVSSISFVLLHLSPGPVPPACGSPSVLHDAPRSDAVALPLAVLPPVGMFVISFSMTLYFRRSPSFLICHGRR